MRIKFEKGITPERMAEAFVNYIYENNLHIGAVNMYIQTFNDQMKAENSREYLVFSPESQAKEEYIKYAANLRRSKFKAVSNG